jgi:hypothetical protein
MIQYIYRCPFINFQIYILHGCLFNYFLFIAYALNISAYIFVKNHTHIVFIYYKRESQPNKKESSGKLLSKDFLYKVLLVSGFTNYVQLLHAS